MIFGGLVNRMKENGSLETNPITSYLTILFNQP
jgi:hypothetical protein